MIVLLAVLAGGLGAAARFAADGALRSRLGDRFPWATLLINVTGSLVLGVLTGFVVHQGSPDEVRTVIGTGFCGGYTTFSTASFETVRLVQRRGVAGPLYGLVTVAGCLGAAAVGLIVTR